MQAIIDRLLQLAADMSQAVLDLETQLRAAEVTKDTGILTAAAALKLVASDLEALVNVAATSTTAAMTTMNHG